MFIENIVEETVKPFVEAANRAIEEYKNANNQSNDIPSQIMKLSQLKDQGILTEDEFLNKKKELLAKM